MRTRSVTTVGDIRQLNAHRLGDQYPVSAYIDGPEGPVLVVWPSTETVTSARMAAERALTAVLGIDSGIAFYYGALYEIAEMRHHLVPDWTRVGTVRDLLRVVRDLPDDASISFLEPYSGSLSPEVGQAIGRRLYLPQSKFFTAMELAMRRAWIAKLSKGLNAGMPI